MDLLDQMAAEMKFVDSHNIVGYLSDPPALHKEFKSMIAGLNSCSISHAVRATPVIYKNLINDFWKNARINKEGADGVDAVESTVRGTQVIISEQTIRQVLEFGDKPEFPIEFPAARVLEALKQMCYEGIYPPTIKKLLPPFWRFLAHTFVNCVSGRKGGSDEISQTATSAIVALVMDWEYNFSKFVFEEMKSNLLGRKKDLFLMYPRFLQMIFDEEYPLIERTGDTLDVKTLGPNTFGLMKQSRKAAIISYQSLKPLVKLGKFADQEEQLNTPVVEEKLETAVPKAPRQFCMEEIEEISDDEEASMTEQELEAAINQSIPQAQQIEVETESMQQPEVPSVIVQQSELPPPPSVIVDMTESVVSDHDDPASTLIHRKRKRSDLSEEGLVQDQILDQIVEPNIMEEDRPSPITDSIPIDQDKESQNVEEDVIPTEVGHVAGSSSMPTGLNISKGKSISPDSELVDVAKLQSRVFELEQESTAKDVMIGKLDIRVSGLEKDNAAKDTKITAFQENLGSLTALVVDLKQHLSQKFSNVFGDESAPQPSTARVFTSAPEVNIDRYLSTGSMTGEERREKQRMLDERKKGKPDLLIMKNSDQNVTSASRPDMYIQEAI